MRGHKARFFLFIIIADKKSSVNTKFEKISFGFIVVLHICLTKIL